MYSKSRVNLMTYSVSLFSKRRRLPNSHLGKWWKTPTFAIFELSVCFSVCIPNFIKISVQLHILRLKLDFQDGGGGHLGKWL